MHCLNLTKAFDCSIRPRSFGLVILKSVSEGKDEEEAALNSPEKT